MIRGGGETAKMLAKHDPQGLAVAKAGLDALRTRCEIAQASKRDKEASALYLKNRSVEKKSQQKNSAKHN